MNNNSLDLAGTATSIFCPRCCASIDNAKTNSGWHCHANILPELLFSHGVCPASDGDEQE